MEGHILIQLSIDHHKIYNVIEIYLKVQVRTPFHFLQYALNKFKFTKANWVATMKKSEDFYVLLEFVCY